MPVANDDQNEIGSDGQLAKKPKTEAQKARERARRKRRRQNKLKNAVFSAGSDVPLVLSPKEAEQIETEPPQDLPLSEEHGVADEIPPAEDVDKGILEEPTVVEEVQPEPTGPVDYHSEQPTEPEMPELPLMTETEVSYEPEPELEPEDEPVPEAPEEFSPSEMEPSQRVFEEGIQDIPVDSDETEQEETEKNEGNLQQANELAQSLKADQGDGLEEIPQKQGLFGRFFDLLVKVTQKNQERDQQSIVIEPPEVIVDSGAQSIGAGLLSKLIKFLIGILLIVALGIGAFWLGSSLKVIDYINQLFAPSPMALQLETGNNADVTLDQDLLRKWGFQTAQIAGSNLGALNDLAYNVFFNASYFGKLHDPMFITETGVSAAIYYGFGREDLFFQNKFVFYVNFLANLRNSNQVKIADVLDGKVRRDEALDGFVKETKGLFEEGNSYRKEIAVQVDDLKISVNSLTPDKDRSETDFFAALDATKAEKADLLIKNFIDITQKQVELKAKLAAMTKLYEYYEAELIDMKLRLDAIDKNREALISGVSVTETPGVELNLIRQ